MRSALQCDVYSLAAHNACILGFPQERTEVFRVNAPLDFGFWHKAELARTLLTGASATRGSTIFIASAEPWEFF